MQNKNTNTHSHTNIINKVSKYKFNLFKRIDMLRLHWCIQLNFPLCVKICFLSLFAFFLAHYMCLYFLIIVLYFVFWLIFTFCSLLLPFFLMSTFRLAVKTSHKRNDVVHLIYILHVVFIMRPNVGNFVLNCTRAFSVYLTLSH